MSSPPVGPVTGIPPATPAGSALLRVEILAQAEAVLEAALDAAAATPTPAKAAAGGPVAATQPDAPAAQPNPVTQVLDAARTAAAQRQGSLAPLLADLAQVVSSPALPSAVRAAIGQVLALRTPLAGPLTAETVRQAVAQSGIFLEAHLAKTPSGAPAPPPDLKAALLILQTALAAAPVVKAPATAPPTPLSLLTASGAPAPAPVAPPAPAPAPAPAPTPAPTAAGLLSAPSASPAPTTDPKAALLNLQSISTGEPAAEPPPASAVGTPVPAAPTLPAGQLPSAAPEPSTPTLPRTAAAATPPPASDPELTPRITLLDAETEPAAAPAPSRATPPGPSPESAASIPPPPHRAAALTAQPASAASLAPDAKAPAIVERLQTAVEQAVARQTLHQLASLPDGQTTAWMFELPLETPQGAAIAQFEIERDGRGGEGGEETAKGWRLRFSIDIEPLGPIHIHLGLNGEQAQVVVWAEREASLQWLRQGAADLASALPAEVVFHPGAPRRPTPAPGQFLDQAL